MYFNRINHCPVTESQEDYMFCHSRAPGSQVLGSEHCGKQNCAPLSHLENVAGDDNVTRTGIQVLSGVRRIHPSTDMQPPRERPEHDK